MNDPTASRAPDLQDVLRSRRRQEGRARRTPVLTDPRLDTALGRRVAVKAEFLQRAGSFKFRGIDNAVECLDPAAAARGVVIVSSGNAGQAAALSAALRGVRCTVVMGDDAVPTKVRAVRSLGATVVSAGTTTEDVFRTCDELVAEHGWTLLHPFDHPEVIAGHGSLSLEVLEDCPEVGTVVVPAGGGGLLASVGLVMKSLAPKVRVIGVQPVGSDAVRRSFAAGTPVALDRPAHSIADGLVLEQAGDLTCSLIGDYVDDVVVVDDEAICRAMELAWTALRVAVEPSAAASLAALMSTRWNGGLEVAVATGGNFDPALLAHVTSGGTAEAWMSRPAAPGAPLDPDH
ncbi:pyridoxal-phosphate dependent enzyme [Streptomyces phaeolivaceus]|uniref:pyridoxal-phosphate dependent enzyme n=1 Tax=Streptomyces phaeolivaceus TaxID=2653200 RepID=UPI00186A4D63|nr:pyridoxal-phosphate dependent enzyme [Streptomyces phaeolivaceus]